MIKPPQLPDLSVLVAESSEYQRRLLREALRSAAIRKVYEVPDGQAVIAASTRLLPDVLILDTDLPGASTLEIMRALTRHPVTMPIILTVSRPTVPFIEAAMRLGLRDILARPIKPSALWARLDTLVATGRIRPGLFVGPSGAEAELGSARF
jgi:PleD family two-component response regulator